MGCQRSRSHCTMPQLGTYSCAPRSALYWHCEVSLPPSPSLSLPLLSSCFGDRVSVCTGWPRTPHIAVASLELAIHLLQPCSKHWDCGYISPHHTPGFNNRVYYLLERGSVKCRSLGKRNQDKIRSGRDFFKENIQERYVAKERTGGEWGNSAMTLNT